MDKLIIALDIDGVLRKKAPFDGTIDFEKLALLRDICSRLDASVVITSTWKDLYELADFKNLLGVDVIGVTTTPAGDGQEIHGRHREVLRFISSLGTPDRRWLAIDDDTLHYPPLKNVFFTESSVGLTDKIAAEIIERFSSPMNSESEQRYCLDHLVKGGDASGDRYYGDVARALAAAIGVPLEDIGKILSGTLVGDPRIILRGIIGEIIREAEGVKGSQIVVSDADFYGQ